MRWLCVGLVSLALAGCSKAPDGNMPGETATSASGVAFDYRYGFRLPSANIADALETQAQACEQLSPARCRITGMDYRLDGSGQATASLDVQVSSSVARSFGHQAVKRVDAAGGALSGAEITGTDTLAATEAAETTQKDAGIDRSAVVLLEAVDDDGHERGREDAAEHEVVDDVGRGVGEVVRVADDSSAEGVSDGDRSEEPRDATGPGSDGDDGQSDHQRREAHAQRDAGAAANEPFGT